MLPFYLFTDTSMARNMILYRYERLEKAIANAKARGYEGALFPWESGSAGDEVTPRYAKDIDGSVIEMDTIDYEHHISAAVAYSVYNYYRVTKDNDFMTECGAKIIFSTARFWASRVTYNKRKKRYEILDVIGPDEFHVKVKNNAYTNLMASWNLEYAYKLYNAFRKKKDPVFGRLVKNMSLRREEIERWKEIVESIYILRATDGVVEQFERYFRKKDIPVKSYNEFFMPEAPQHLSYRDFNKTQFVKQADTLMLFYLLPELFSHENKIKNYGYYIKRTLHQSSLSHSVHSLLAAQLGDRLRAYALYLFAAQVDLKNLHNNTDGGMHMANAGGVWQAAIFGFAGITLKERAIAVDPRLPGHWNSMSFDLFWEGRLLRFAISKRRVMITYLMPGPDSGPVQVYISGKPYSIELSGRIDIKMDKKEDAMAPPKRVKEILKPGQLIFVNENDSVKEVTRLLRERNVSSVPVVTGDKKLCGIISKQDIVNATEREDLSQLKARDIMTRSVEYLKSCDHLEIALRLFTERSFQVLPVVQDKKLIGCVTRKEILSACGNEYY
jgi:kojibiose phosphorylase